MQEPADRQGLTSWIELDGQAFFNNLKFFRQRIGEKTRLCAVVKANAYGHGIAQMAGLALDSGVDCFAVHSVDEALLLRSLSPTADVLILGPVPIPRLEEAVKGKFKICMYDKPVLKALSDVCRRLGVPAAVHLKMETGTNRQGIPLAELPQFLELLHRCPELSLEGIYTHFANIEDTTDHDYARFQMENFRKCAEAVEGAGFSPPIRHTACSAASLLFPETLADMVRIGISLYGLWPSRETYICYVLRSGNFKEERLEPVLSWKARVCQAKDVPEGACISYGCTYKTTHPSRIAVMPVGYFDGYDRHLSNNGHVLIHGKRAPVRGRVCMNFFMADVTHISGVHSGDEVVLIGRQGEEQITAGDIAERIGTIHYEVVTRLHPSIPRLVV
jgi:alanine racemase